MSRHCAVMNPRQCESDDIVAAAHGRCCLPSTCGMGQGLARRPQPRGFCRVPAAAHRGNGCGDRQAPVGVETRHPRNPCHRPEVRGAGAGSLGHGAHAADIREVRALNRGECQFAGSRLPPALWGGSQAKSGTDALTLGFSKPCFALRFRSRESNFKVQRV